MFCVSPGSQVVTESISIKLQDEDPGIKMSSFNMWVRPVFVLQVRTGWMGLSTSLNVSPCTCRLKFKFSGGPPSVSFVTRLIFLSWQIKTDPSGSSRSVTDGAACSTALVDIVKNTCRREKIKQEVNLLLSITGLYIQK